MDVAEVGISVTEELEPPDEGIPMELLSDVSNTLTGQNQTIVDDTTIIAALSPSANAFTITPNYMDPPPGSTVDRGWRLSILSFVLGAFPQAVKVFAMKGVPFTQVFIAIFVVSFIVPEAFRSLAGPVGQFNLYPLPIVLNAKSLLSHVWLLCLFYVSTFSCMGTLFITSSWKLAIISSTVVKVSTILMLASSVALLLFGALHFFRSLYIFACTPNGMRSYMYDSKMFQHVRTKLVAFIAGLFALSSSTVEWCLSLLCLYAVCLVGTVWLLWGKPLAIRFDSIGAFLIMGVSSFGTLFLTSLGPYVAYRVLFMGYPSNAARHLCGTKGTIDEFLKGMFILVNFATYTIAYAGSDYSSSATFKPPWTEVLG